LLPAMDKHDLPSRLLEHAADHEAHDRKDDS
jgi:hypothetical protein